MTLRADGDQYSAVFVILASIVSAVAAVVAFICCCHGSTKNNKRSKKRKTSEEREEAAGENTAAVAAAEHTVECKGSPVSDRQRLTRCGAGEGSASSLRSSAGDCEDLDGNANQSLVNDEPAVSTSETQISEWETTNSHNDSKDDASGQSQAPGDFSTIRKAGVNVKLALAAYETGKLSQSTATEKSVLRTPRKKLDAALKDQIVIKPGRPPLQRHTVGADAFKELDEQPGVTEDAEEERRKQEVKRILPDLAAATPKRTSGKTHLRPEDALTNDEMHLATEGHRQSSGSRNSDTESDYFGAVQRQDAVLRSVEKARAPHKHKKGKVPTAYIEDSEDAKRSRPHSSGDILDSVSER